MQTSTILEKIMNPINELFEKNSHSRNCPTLADNEFISLGIRRALGEDKSGCGFLQRMIFEGVANIKKSDYFESIKSARRLDHLKEINEKLNKIANEKLTKNDVFSQFKELDGFDIYASDGSYCTWASHDEKFIRPAKEKEVEKEGEAVNDERKNNLEGTKRSCQHFYSCNLRSMIMLHLTVALIGSDAKEEEARNKKINRNFKRSMKELEIKENAIVNKIENETIEKMKEKEHDMHALKRLSIDELRLGALKGQKVLHIYDRAGIDHYQWHNWKQSGGIYLLSREKSNSKLSTMAQLEFDRSDPVNAGIEFDEYVSNNNSGLIRRVTFLCPETSQEYCFLTNLPVSIRPGVIAFLYKTRWDVEKQFDVFKNKLEEKKSWASSKTAKTMQAQFICLANNLALLLNEKIETEDKVVYELDKSRKVKKMKLREDAIIEKKLKMPSPWKLCLRVSQLTIKFYRWIRANLCIDTSWEEAMKTLALVYAMK